MKVAFVACLREFVEDLLKPENLRPKVINGKEITLQDFLVYAKVYKERLHGDQLPTPQTLYDATVTATNTAVVSKCLSLYETRLSEKTRSEPCDAKSFEALHVQTLSEIDAFFEASVKMGGEFKVQVAREEMAIKIAGLCELFRAANSSNYERKCAGIDLAILEAKEQELRSKVATMSGAAKELRCRLQESEAERDRIRAQHR